MRNNKISPFRLVMWFIDTISCDWFQWNGHFRPSHLLVVGSLQCIVVLFCDVTKHIWPAGVSHEQVFYCFIPPCDLVKCTDCKFLHAMANFVFFFFFFFFTKTDIQSGCPQMIPLSTAAETRRAKSPSSPRTEQAIAKGTPHKAASLARCAGVWVGRKPLDLHWLYDWWDSCHGFRIQRLLRQTQNHTCFSATVPCTFPSRLPRGWGGGHRQPPTVSALESAFEIHTLSHAFFRWIPTFLTSFLLWSSLPGHAFLFICFPHCAGNVKQTLLASLRAWVFRTETSVVSANDQQCASIQVWLRTCRIPQYSCRYFRNFGPKHGSKWPKTQHAMLKIAPSFVLVSSYKKYRPKRYMKTPFLLIFASEKLIN